jgi:hypothetical protein
MRTVVRGRVECDVYPGHTVFFVERKMLQLHCADCGMSYSSFVEELRGLVTVEEARKNLLSGTNGLRDLVGNALDGDPGNPGPDSHVLRFIVDDANAALPDFNAFAPLGGLVYRTEVAGRAVHATTDTDSFTVTLDAGQTLTLWASQVAGSTRLAIELFDAQTGGSSLGLAEASSLGQTVLLQTLAVTGGSYRVEVRSLEGSGQYSLKALLNAALENESVGGAGNNSLATAQDLTASLISTGSDRAAVVGQFNETAPAADWYSVHLDAGQSASAVLTPDSGLNAAELIAEATRTIGGGGGKGDELAVAGGRDAEGIPAALDQVRAQLG